MSGFGTQCRRAANRRAPCSAAQSSTHGGGETTFGERLAPRAPRASSVGFSNASMLATSGALGTALFARAAAATAPARNASVLAASSFMDVVSSPFIAPIAIAATSLVTVGFIMHNGMALSRADATAQPSVIKQLGNRHIASMLILLGTAFVSALLAPLSAFPSDAYDAASSAIDVGQNLLIADPTARLCIKFAVAGGVSASLGTALWVRKSLGRTAAARLRRVTSAGPSHI